MAVSTVLKEADIKIYASVLMNNSVSLEEKAVALTELYNFFTKAYKPGEIYKKFGLGVYYRDGNTGNIKTTKAPVVEPA
jgi:hypothetical protein